MFSRVCETRRNKTPDSVSKAYAEWKCQRTFDSAVLAFQLSWRMLRNARLPGSGDREVSGWGLCGPDGPDVTDSTRRLRQNKPWTRQAVCPCARTTGPGRWSTRTLTHLTRYPHTQVGTRWQRVCHCVRNSRLQLIKSSSLVSNRLELAGWASRFASSPSSLSVCVCVCVCVSLSVAWWSKSPVAYATY